MKSIGRSPPRSTFAGLRDWASRPARVEWPAGMLSSWLGALTGLRTAVFDVLLPIGISFYTCRSLGEALLQTPCSAARGPPRSH